MSVFMYQIVTVFLLALFVDNSAGECRRSPTTCSGTHCPRQVCSGRVLFEDHFNFFDFKKWQHEQTLAGGGNWEFQWYTNNRSNSFTKNGKLHIRPTLTADHIGEDNLSKMTLDIIGGNNPASLCTNPSFFGCMRTGTPTHILNPIKSAKLRTSNSFSFKYGRVEVKARLPSGDWLWPAIWFLPQYNAYGEHPSSGEIDLMESRGNKNLKLAGKNIGSEQVASTLHWGPYTNQNAFQKTHYELNSEPGQGYETNFRKYQMDWTPEHFNFYVDDVLIGTVNPNTTFWDFGEFNSTGMENPWRFGSKMAPFDQEFYLIINLAVGGQGYFPDAAESVPPKPWKNTSPQAATDFWNGRSSWLPTWKMNETEGESSSFLIDYVKIWAL